MLRNEWAMVMCVRRGWLALLVLLSSLQARPAAAQLIEGLEAWSDSAVGLSTTKWAGPRVPVPIPAPRPASTPPLRSQAWPLAVHAPANVPTARREQALASAEAAFAVLRAAGFATSFGDGSGPRDLYLVNEPDAASASSDATGNFSALDGTRAFARVDARTPSAQLPACVAQALMDAELLELDPAEDASLRHGLAAYFARLASGSACEDEPRAAPHQSPFAALASAAAWFDRLGARQDRNRGRFLFDMWQFARQRTWEGRELRASPDLFEAIAKALSLAREDFDLVVGELAESAGHAAGAPRVAFAALPMFADKRAPPLEVLGSTQVRVDLGEPRPGTRLRAWSRAEAGRYTLSALRLDALGRPLSRLDLAPRKDPSGQLSIELDARTFAVAITLTRVADTGLPDPDAPADDAVRAGLIIDAVP